jgi:hypothetical protein
MKLRSMMKSVQSSSVLYRGAREERLVQLLSQHQSTARIYAEQHCCALFAGTARHITLPKHNCMIKGVL